MLGASAPFSMATKLRTGVTERSHHLMSMIPVVSSLPDAEQRIPPSAKQTLSSIRYLIMDTQWDIGLFGGVKIKDQYGNTNTIPGNMGKILEEIKKAQEGKQTWEDALNKVESVVKEADTKAHGLFNKRGETTKLFYKQLLAQLKSSAPAAEPDVPTVDNNGPSMKN